MIPNAPTATVTPRERRPQGFLCTDLCFAERDPFRTSEPQPSSADEVVDEDDKQPRVREHTRDSEEGAELVDDLSSVEDGAEQPDEEHPPLPAGTQVCRTAPSYRGWVTRQWLLWWRSLPKCHCRRSPSLRKV